MEGINDILSTPEEQEIVPSIVFLTDGEPTNGELNLTIILNNIEKRNTRGIPIFSLSFGENANYPFMRQMSVQNNAFARKIYEAADVALQLTGFYDEVSSVLVSNVTFRYLDDAVVKNTVTNVIFPNYYAGSELVVAGRLSDNSISNVGMSVHGRGANGIVEMSSNSIENMPLSDEPDIEAPPSLNFTNVAEKIWAYITIKQLLEERMRERNITIRDKIKEKATKLALKVYLEDIY